MDQSSRVRDHLANERTFLAWVRTAVGVIIFGFAIGRFGLALRQLAGVQGEHVRTTGLSLWFGSASMFLGVALMLAALYRYRRMQRQIDAGTFQTSGVLITWVAWVIVIFGIALIAYLVFTQHALS